MPLGLDSGIIAHEVGHSILDYASSSNLHRLNAEQGPCSTAPNDLNTCSRTVYGSVDAIHEGVADVVSIFLFPESTPLGEMMFNTTEGLDHCRQLPRDVKKNQGEQF